MNRYVRLLLLLTCVTCAQGAMIIHANFDPSLTTYLSASDVTNWENAFNYAAGVYSSLFVDPITVNITVAATNNPSVLGESSSSIYGAFPYSVIKNALAADATSQSDATAMANLPASDPTNGGHFWVSTAEAKALGANLNVTDGTITFGTAFAYTFDPNNRAVAGKYDFIGIAEHEISEVLGRFALEGTTVVDGSPDFSLFDLFGYTSAGHLSLNPSNNGVYFSIDGGKTDLRNFNNPGGGDLKDWASGQGPDSFNAFMAPGIADTISPVDVKALDVIGYNLAPVPEPGTAVPFIALVAGFAGFRLRRRRYDQA